MQCGRWRKMRRVFGRGKLPPKLCTFTPTLLYKRLVVCVRNEGTLGAFGNRGLRWPLRLYRIRVDGSRTGNHVPRSRRNPHLEHLHRNGDLGIWIYDHSRRSVPDCVWKYSSWIGRKLVRRDPAAGWHTYNTSGRISESCRSEQGSSIDSTGDNRPRWRHSCSRPLYHNHDHVSHPRHDHYRQRGCHARDRTGQYGHRNT